MLCPTLPISGGWHLQSTSSSNHGPVLLLPSNDQAGGLTESASVQSPSPERISRCDVARPVPALSASQFSPPGLSNVCEARGTGLSSWPHSLPQAIACTMPVLDVAGRGLTFAKHQVSSKVLQQEENIFQRTPRAWARRAASPSSGTLALPEA